MRARADAATATGERILDAAEALFFERPAEDLALAEVAARAGVSVQTVLRRFGSREGLLAAAARRAASRIQSQRDSVVAGDLAGAVRMLLDHYEEMGERVLRMLAEEHRHPSLREIVDRGRAVHRAWCERVFASTLEGLAGVERGRRLAQLVAVTDVYVWKLLRRDRALSRRQTELALRELLTPLDGGAR